MNLPGKITAAASALVIGGLIALAAPAVASIGQAAHDTAEGAGNLASLLEPAPSPTPDQPAYSEATGDGRRMVYLGGGVTVAVAPGECTEALIAGDHLLGTLVDQGESTYAHGTVVFNDAGKIKGYEVADGDTLFAIGERFCMSSAHIFYANRPADLPPDTWYSIQPGQVLILDPGA